MPADLGFYDLQLPEAREAQAALAAEYAIYVFCYYGYWLHGEGLPERTFQEILESGKPVLSSHLCWANGNWTRVWNGRQQEIFLRQDYSDDDDLSHPV